VRIVVRPVHQPAEIVPFVNATELHTVSHSDRYTLRDFDVVSDQYGSPVPLLDDEALVRG
jgi:hypothetical protein